mmetsp:Transcript_27682/g.35992  ORF Transcript_27682/g.35992 Transcript_27682/m.35992 type:complete len:272 (+) Transcript_27682:96-911(+)
MEVTKLTESMVLHVTKKNSLKEVTTVNIWGMQITDISLVSRLPNLEVLSMSLNRINTLKHFSKCRMLRELYVRKNCVANLEEIIYLKDLPRLRILWLAENVCATSNSCYRKFVLRYLPNLTKLDNEDVTEDEVKEAMNEAPNAEMRRLIALANELERLQREEEENKRRDEIQSLYELRADSSPRRPATAPRQAFHQSLSPKGRENRSRSVMGGTLSSFGVPPPMSPDRQSSNGMEGTRGNVLSAVLTLLNELDGDELGIVELRCKQLLARR